jgi:hypothetical protein
MDIKDFVKESLMQIADSINEANVELDGKGTYIPSGDMIGEGVLYSAIKGSETRHFMKVEFDLAVTVSQEHGKSGGTGLSIASLANVGIKGDNKEGKEEISRIKFMVPMALPEKKK